MKQYQELLREILENGVRQPNRTGIDTLSIPGAMLKFDLDKGFPAVTTKKLAFKSVVGELVGFLRASRNAADFRSLGCKVWDQNANENKQWLENPYRVGDDDLGSVYGVQWRQWPGFKLIDLGMDEQIADATNKGYSQIAVTSEGTVGVFYKAIDQLRTCLDTIVNNPNDRRILFHGWNLAQLDEMALPPCHLLYQFLPNPSTRELSLCLYIRSNDMFLGSPFNVAEASMLLSLVARLTGYTPRWFTCFIGDSHIYANHLDQVKEQLSRVPYPLPKLVINDRVPEFDRDGYHPEWLNLIEPSDFGLEGYLHHDSIKADMAV